jgi:cytochrome P450
MPTASLGRPLPVPAEMFSPDPHRGFEQLRPRTGLIELGGMPLAIRHADVVRLMDDARTRQIETEALEAQGIRAGALHRFYANSLLVSNPPAHARRRTPLARSFAHRLIETWRPRIRALANELIDLWPQTGEVEFVSAFASPLPSRLIAQILGAPEQDAPRFSAEVYAMSRGLGAFKPSLFPSIEAGAEALTAYVAGLLAARRAAPRDDVLSDYVANVDAAGMLSEAETLIQIVTLIIAGSDTTRFGLTAMLDLLLRHPEQWQALCADRALIAPAVREALRYEPPVGSMGRVVIEPLTIDGVTLPPGTPLGVSILSAQRDEAVYASPQRFDIRRIDHPRWSVSFGGGPHRCLGEALARAEMEEALAVLRERVPRLALVEAPALKGHIGIRGVTPMRLTIHGR